ncbi:Na(+)/H(+) antiporter subunit D [Wenzhouxiangella sp. AB-CW3]|uniref:Na(+)/H(+) antiporter subunit D n=1 Tax=Wenzhouxiangella sp. AB-CW3 TaxID=2771012 RepID=UPI00168BAC2C|nr:Na(+)/H(+) antiporter subunit D [Wenzhouxiangella sp. AB-CW3]QOC22159.1 Na(+)/H(+) antiporter subunit D [Wenzhouxiangella sp. AB-CW3]
MTIEWLHPTLVLLAGTLILPLLKGRAMQAWMVLLPLLVLGLLTTLQPGVHGQFDFLDMTLTMLRVDALAMVFAWVFAIILLVGAIYALHVHDRFQHAAAFVYAASALGVVFAGDLITLYVFWELMALSSVWLIWRRKSDASFRSGFRYLIVHAFGGLLLLAGIIMYYLETGSITFEQIETRGPAFWLILVAFMINAAVPPLHAWLTDAYPEATITGAVFLSALTTKTAVYTLIRGYPGAEILVWMGAIMTLYGVTYAMLSNEIRRLLSYHIVSQVGYMVTGVGLGTALALNGAASHAFTHILYKALLFMGAGAVIYMTGKSKLSELGGLYRWMPWTFLLYMIGGLSISAFPLFSGYVSKTMIVEAAALDQRALIWLMVTMASAGTFLSVGLKLPWFTWLGRDSGLKPREAPLNMRLAMGLAAALCIMIGIMPGPLYALLPSPVDFNAYTLSVFLKEMQVLMFTGLGFFMLLKYLEGKDRITLDTDWLYRRLAPGLISTLAALITRTDQRLRQFIMERLTRMADVVERNYGKDGRLARSWPIGSMAMWTAIVLAMLLLFGIGRE